MTNTISTYHRYLRIQKIINILSKKECSIEDISKKTKIPIQTVYRITEMLVEHNVITARQTKSKKYNHKLQQVFKIKSRRRKSKKN